LRLGLFAWPRKRPIQGGAAHAQGRGAGSGPVRLNSIFNPFLTTKPQGVGLGVVVVSKIVDEHGGKITVESEPGKGSVFNVLLPMSPAQKIAS